MFLSNTRKIYFKVPVITLLVPILIRSRDKNYAIDIYPVSRIPKNTDATLTTIDGKAKRQYLT